MPRITPYENQLEALAQAGRRRSLIIPEGRDFSSNDYLGLARSTFLREAAKEALDGGMAHGSGGSRLLGGNHPEHESLETYAAAHYDADSALFFSSGYTANLALFSTVPQQGDLVLYDSLVHASAHDGMKLGRADTQMFAHNDCNDLESRIRQFRASGGTGTIWVATESLFSMDGDTAPLADLLQLADRHDAMLVIDEAHATGVFGTGGRGLSADLGRRENILSLRTCGKALGVEGGLITMPVLLRDFFVNRARAFIFSTAPSPLTAHLVERAIRHVDETPVLQQQLHAHIALTRELLSGHAAASGTGSQIFPVILGDDRKAVAIASQLQQQGFDVRAIRPPTVPAGTARLRISLTLNVSEQDIQDLAEALEHALQLEEAA
ncbi:8-amino-7-oxononanoate synthase [Parasphingorhabdus marina DSM 22363]|uniref:8-amino-7-oxononanoate synthase n=1 Tax=Parasphingorhabdus marina DSM 22363 TaxID=1123272 RepID=A0A1N6CNT8_9SPHN|nr:8-amino-7-oxononanoate synthase [Parasphingorhabdus marina]SIN60105.1 8-amino-7-oxononanoate synthase [Parasphingorhabdus marina DSM 22363]